MRGRWSGNGIHHRPHPPWEDRAKSAAVAVRDGETCGKLGSVRRGGRFGDSLTRESVAARAAVRALDSGCRGVTARAPDTLYEDGGLRPPP